MRSYLLDTCIYGVLVDKKHRDYEIVKKILDYAREYREQFVTTFIVFRELNLMSKDLQSIVLPEYYTSVSKDTSMLEIVLSERQSDIQKLAWKYIQDLKIEDAEKVLPDAENYSLACHAGVDTFVTINRRGMLSKEKQSKIKRINRKMRVKYVIVMTPNKFYELLTHHTS